MVQMKMLRALVSRCKSSLHSPRWDARSGFARANVKLFNIRLAPQESSLRNLCVNQTFWEKPALCSGPVCKLQTYQTRIKPVFFHQACMGAIGHDAALIHNDDPVRTFYGGQTMGHENGCPVF